MAINFPDSPVENDTHTVGNSTWTYDGTVWKSSATTITPITKYTTTLNGATGIQLITHNLNTTDIGIEIWNTDDEQSFTPTTIVDANSVNVIIGSTGFSGKVVIW